MAKKQQSETVVGQYAVLQPIFRDGAIRKPARVERGVPVAADVVTLTEDDAPDFLERGLVEPYEPPAAGAPTGDDTGTGGSADADDRSTGAGGRSGAGSDQRTAKPIKAEVAREPVTPRSAGGGQTGGAKPGTKSGSASAKTATGQSGSDG